MANPKPMLVGLTGNIACGKSTVARMLGDLGYAVVDADEISREVTARGTPAAGEIRTAFGKQVFTADGSLDRTKLRALVFADEDKRRKLEAILHPAIRKRSLERFAELADAGRKSIVYEATLIIEAGRAGDFDGILVVACSPANQLARLRARDPKLSAELAQKIISSQMPQSEKRTAATWIIENDGDEAALRSEVAKWATANLPLP